MLTPVIDTSKEYGLVLEGGGAKGAYQIGAWKALKEAGVKINAVAGTSVGALNGALICMDELELAQQMWSNLTYSQVMDVDDTKMELMLEREMPFREAVKEAFRHMSEGGVDVTPLKDMLDKVVDEEKIRNSPVDIFIKTFSVDEMKELDIDLKEVEPGQMKDFLLASAYIFPLFKNEKLHGKMYIDGGAINIIDFNPKKSVRNMKIGYYDAKRMVYGLKGKIYYIEENQEECYYLKQLVQIPESSLERLCQWHHIKGSAESRYRSLTELILPGTALELKLSREWNYKELYLAALEATAKLCRVPKYQIYTVEELVGKIQEKLNRMSQEERENLPAFTAFFDSQPEEELS